MPEPPFEITHLSPRLRADFTGKLPEAQLGSAEDREKNFLTRALAAYAVHKLAHCTLDEAATAVVDGGGDGGIDAAYYSATTSCLWVVQSKYIASGRGQPELGEVSKFNDGLEELLEGHFEVFEQNAAWRGRIPLIKANLEYNVRQVCCVLVYSGIHLLSPDRLRLFDKLKQRFAYDDPDYFTFQHYNLTSIHAWLTGADKGPGIERVELTLLCAGWVKDPYETVFGLIRLADLATLQTTYGDRLVAANLRGYKGSTEVNNRVLGTIREEPEHFFYLNNGLTAYCERLEVNNLDRSSAEQKRIVAHGFSIVNGAQTLGSVEEAFGPNPDPPPRGHVFLKVISLERCEDDRAFARRITESTNFQNQIGSRDFVALTEQQERIARQLHLSGIHYHYKDAENRPDPDDENFSFDEAATALACLEQEAECDLCARVLANRKSLWSFEKVYPEADPILSRYERLFPHDRSARTIWRAVQAQRAVLDRMRDNARSSAGVRKAFFENARWLLLNIVFLRLRPEQGEAVPLTSDEVTAISTAALDIAETLWSVAESQGLVTRRADSVTGTENYEQTRHFRSVFCDANDCQRLRNGTLARLNQLPASLPSSPASGTTTP